MLCLLCRVCRMALPWAGRAAGQLFYTLSVESRLLHLAFDIAEGAIIIYRYRYTSHVLVGSFGLL